MPEVRRESIQGQVRVLRVEIESCFSYMSSFNTLIPLSVMLKGNVPFL